MTDLVCEWCGTPLNDRQLVACNASHRLKRWRWLHGIPISPYGLVERPPDGSVLLMGHPTPGTAGRAVQTAPTASDNGSRVSNGGLQVSYQRAWVRVARGLRYELNVPADQASALAKSWVRDVLPERQKARAA